MQLDTASTPNFRASLGRIQTKLDQAIATARRLIAEAIPDLGDLDLFWVGDESIRREAIEAMIRENRGGIRELQIKIIPIVPADWPEADQLAQAAATNLDLMTELETKLDNQKLN